MFVANRGEIALRIVTACQRARARDCVVGASEADTRWAGGRAGPTGRSASGRGPAARAICARDLSSPAALATGLRRAPPRLRLPVGESAARGARRTSTASRSSGRRPAAIELAGDKLRAREAATRAGARGACPVANWRISPPSASAIAEASGYPVLVKAAGGGGGAGIKLVDDPDALDAPLSLARSEARRRVRRRPPVPRSG